MQFYYRGDDLAPFWHFLGLELLYNGIFIITLQVLSELEVTLLLNWSERSAFPAFERCRENVVATINNIHF